MPKNTFQRPAPITRSHTVPRHGKPVPAPVKGEMKPVAQKPDTAAKLPPLQHLLGRLHT
jgi:hypothetical protein